MAGGRRPREMERLQLATVVQVSCGERRVSEESIEADLLLSHIERILGEGAGEAHITIDTLQGDRGGFDRIKLDEGDSLRLRVDHELVILHRRKGIDEQLKELLIRHRLQASEEQSRAGRIEGTDTRVMMVTDAIVVSMMTAVVIAVAAVHAAVAIVTARNIHAWLLLRRCVNAAEDAILLRILMHRLMMRRVRMKRRDGARVDLSIVAVHALRDHRRRQIRTAVRAECGTAVATYWIVRNRRLKWRRVCLKQRREGSAASRILLWLIRWNDVLTSAAATTALRLNLTLLVSR